MDRGAVPSKTVLVILAEGFEEIEAVTPIDLLRRAGVACSLAALDPPLLVRGRNGIILQAEKLLDELTGQLFDAVLLPGGPGTARLKRDGRVDRLLREHAAAGRLVSAICAAPTVLAQSGLLQGRRFTAHESVREQIPALDETQAVVVDGTLITSRGAGTAVPFGLALAGALAGAQRADEVAAAIHVVG